MERNTIQRRAICRVLEETGRPLGPPEIFEEARRHAKGLGIATVYRTIKSLLGEGYLQPVELPGEPPRYERAGNGHHHHFRCNGCHRVFDLEGCPFAFKQIVPKGFTLEGHDLTLLGRCAECAA